MTYIIGHITGLKPAAVVMMIGNAHVYKNHIEQVREQCLRKPTAFPMLDIGTPMQHVDGEGIAERVQRGLDWIATYAIADIRLIGYGPQAPIKGVMN